MTMTEKREIIIETERLTLRKVTLDDIPELLKWNQLQKSISTLVNKYHHRLGT